MSELTIRDRIWAQALAQLLNHDRLRRGDLDFAPSERGSVRRTLCAMEELGILEREAPDSRIWYGGEALCWMQRATPGHEVVWDPAAERLVLVDDEEAV